MEINTEKEIRLRLEQEYKDKVTNYEKEKSALPGSLSGSRGVAQTLRYSVGRHRLTTF